MNMMKEGDGLWLLVVVGGGRGRLFCFLVEFSSCSYEHNEDGGLKGG